MLIKPNIDDLLEKVAGNRYKLVTIISKRARQLEAGAVPMIMSDEKSVVTIASLEFAKDMYCFTDNKEASNKKFLT